LSDVPAPARAHRSTRNPRTVVEPESDEVEDEDAEGEEEEQEEGDEEEEIDVDAEGDLDQELLANEDSEEDAEGEEDDEMDELNQHPPPPIIKQHPPSAKAGAGSKPNVTVTAPSEGPLKSVEEKEVDMEEDDEELSELDENDENGVDDEDEDDDDNTDEDDIDGSRSATPDLSKLTRRQRGQYEEDVAGGLMALSNEAQKKKHLTAEEHAMRRAEMARRRKNLSEKRNEEEKVCRTLALALTCSASETNL